jgi:hypothetical protein
LRKFVSRCHLANHGNSQEHCAGGECGEDRDPLRGVQRGPAIHAGRRYADRHYTEKNNCASAQE